MANYSLCLEPDDFRGQLVQRMHAYNATLAKIQEPDGIPISSRIGHAIILFYPGEHEPCLDPGDLSIFSSMFDRDDDDTVARAMQNDMGIDQDKDMDLDDNDTRLALHHHYSYPPDMGPASASVQLTPPSTPKVPLEEGEIFNPLPQSNYPWQIYMCRYDTTPANEPSIKMQPFPILRGSTHPPMPHSALPSTFILPIQRIITIKLDEARAVFQVPKDYTLRMLANDHGTALILHNPVYLKMVQQLLYPRNIDLYALPTAKPSIKVVKFRAKVFELVTYAPKEGDTEVELEGETDNMPEMSRGGRTLHRMS
ncbi:hypothetical protein ARMGADRAFT_1035558 [Armillaria gallica]|uniref:Uncharacterized protein n=1 Tax=Armillaria gallica TaxID=47427 RepID=A0A2H3D4P9_ARMGA|nr:hypothetical protein ARMGADRAFT_1035558 [Armillaria gallica]